MPKRAARAASFSVDVISNVALKSFTVLPLKEEKVVCD